jgi:hypothetical protein
MKPIRLTTLGIIAAGTIIGVVGALAAAAPTRPMPEVPLVTPAYYCCWWSYWYKKWSNYCGANKYYAPRYYHPRYRYTSGGSADFSQTPGPWPGVCACSFHRDVYRPQLTKLTVRTKEP